MVICLACRNAGLSNVLTGESVVELCPCFCEDCHLAFQEDDKKHQQETYAHTLFQAIWPVKGADKSAVCYQMNHCATKVVDQKFQSGKTEDGAILIDL
jgi:predicted secreted acid phosphatase